MKLSMIFAAACLGLLMTSMTVSAFSGKNCTNKSGTNTPCCPGGKCPGGKCLR